MRWTRSILKSYDHERGKKLPLNELNFEDIWSLELFTHDEDLCNAFQKDQRIRNSGCNWKLMSNGLFASLKSLQFVQTMDIEIFTNCTVQINSGQQTVSRCL